MTFALFFGIKELFLSILDLIRLSKMVLLNIKNRHLLDVASKLLLESSILPKFGVNTLSIAVYLINKLPTSVLNFDTPDFHLYNQHPNYRDMHIFSCVCFVFLLPHERHKLSAQSVKCAFIGYSISHKGYVCYDPLSHRLRISHHVVLWKSIFLFIHVASLPKITNIPYFHAVTPTLERFKPGFVYERRRPPSPPPEFDMSSKSNQAVLSHDAPDSGTALCWSIRISQPPNQYDFSHMSLNTTLSSVSIPFCYSKAINYDYWHKSMADKLRAL